MLIGARTAAWSGKALPYDAQVEYLESSGTQYILLGLVGKRINVSVKFAPTGTFQVDHWMFGGNMFSDSTYKRIGFYPTTVFTWNGYNMNCTGILYQTDDEGITAGFDTYVTPNLSFQLFAGRWGGNPFGLFSARMFFTKVYQNDDMIMDLIPVRIGSVGYMYDRVSGEFFGNVGSGSFIIGPDV